MALTIWISKFLGPVILVLGMPMIFSPESLQETTKRFLADSPLVLVSGVLAMTAGLSIVNTHNVWVLDWPLIVTLFGWALVLGGASRIRSRDARRGGWWHDVEPPDHDENCRCLQGQGAIQNHEEAGLARDRLLTVEAYVIERAVLSACAAGV